MKALTIAVAATGLLAVAGCGGGSPAKTAAPPAQCPRALSATAAARHEAAYYTGVTDEASLENALTAAMGDTSSGSEDTDLDHIAAARSGAPASLGAPLGSLAADFRALNSDLDADPASPVPIGQDARSVTADAAQVRKACAR